MGVWQQRKNILSLSQGVEKRLKQSWPKFNVMLRVTKNPNLTIGIGLVFLAGLLMLPWINRPFTGHHDFNGAFYSQIARNYIRYGLVKTKLGQVTSHAGTQPKKFVYHTHHPPLLPLLLAGSYSIFGEHEWVARSTVAFFSLGSVLLFFFIVSQATSSVLAVAATALLVTNPLFIYNSILPVHEPLALFFILLQIYAFNKWIQTRKRAHLVALIVGVILGNLSAWPTFYVVPLLIANELRLRRSHYLRLLFFLQLVSGLIFAFHFLHIRLLTGDWFGGGFHEAFLRRIGLTPEVDPRYVYSTGKYVSKLLTRFKNFYGVPLLLTSIGGIVVSFTKKANSSVKGVVLVLAGLALVHPILFRNAVFVHDYLLIYTIPVISVTAALGLGSAVAFLFERYAGQRSLKVPWDTMMYVTTFLLFVNLVATSVAWIDLWKSVEWYESSLMVGSYLRQNTSQDQNIMVMNRLLKREEAQLSYYADRIIAFPPDDFSSLDDLDDPDVLVAVRTDYQFPQEIEDELLKTHRYELTDRGVEFYYRK
jgi:hypothetical protein